MPIRVGVIGAGVMGADHIKNLGTAISGADVTFVADLDAGRAAEAAPPSARITTDPSELINSSEVDAVVVASHDSTLLSLGFMRRFDPGYVALRRSVQERAQGEPLLVRCTSRNAAAGPGTTAESAITNSAIHELDIIPWLLGSPITEVSWQAGRSSVEEAGTRRAAVPADWRPRFAEVLGRPERLHATSASRSRSGSTPSSLQ